MKAFWLGACLALSLGAMAQSPREQYEEAFQRRGRLLTDRVADSYAFAAPGREGATSSVPDPEKYNWPATIARFHKYGSGDSVGNRRIFTFRNQAPFHFTFVGMARIMALYPEAPNMQTYYQQYLQNVWNRTDSYNGWTGEGTENHLSMSRTSAYLYAQYAAERFPAAFPDAAQKMADAKSYILSFTKRAYEVGTGEWNSSTYGVYNYIGYLNLYDFAHDPEVRLAAKAMLDYYTAEFALHYVSGLTAGSESRSNGATQAMRSGTDYLSWLYFGDPGRAEGNNFWNGNDFIQGMHAVTSRFRPHPELVRLAVDKSNGGEYQNSKPAYLQDRASYVKQKMWLASGLALGSAMLPYGGWGGGSFQFATWRLVSQVSDTSGSRINDNLVTGGGRYYNTLVGRCRNPFDQVMQNKNVLVFMTKTPNDATLGPIETQVASLLTQWENDWNTDFSVRFPGDIKQTMRPIVTNLVSARIQNNAAYVSYPASATVAFSAANDILYLQLSRAYVALRPLALSRFTTATNEGSNNSRRMVLDSASRGRVCGYVLEVVEGSAYPTLAAFQTAYEAGTSINRSQLVSSDQVSYTGLNGEALVMTYQSTGSHEEPLYDWGYGTQTRQIFPQSPPFQQPSWPNGASNGRIPAYSVNGQAFNPAAVWPVYSGTAFEIGAGEMKIRGADFIDYRGRVPQYEDSVLVPRHSLYACLGDGPFALQALNTGGTWRGPGVSNGVFDPRAAGLGRHTLLYVKGSDSITSSIWVRNSPVLNGLSGTSLVACISSAGQIPSLSTPLAGASTYQWFLNGQAVSGQTSRTYSGLLWGRIQVAASHRACPTDTVGVYLSPAVLSTNLVQNNDTLQADVTLFSAPGLIGNLTYSWSRGGTPLATTTRNRIGFTQSGNYTVEVRVNGNPACVGTASLSVTGLNESLAQALSLHPNPTQDRLWLRSESVDLSRARLSLLEVSGRQLWNQAYPASGEVSLASLPAGMYVLQIRQPDGRQAQWRVVKE